MCLFKSYFSHDDDGVCDVDFDCVDAVLRHTESLLDFSQSFVIQSCLCLSKPSEQRLTASHHEHLKPMFAELHSSQLLIAMQAKNTYLINNYQSIDINVYLNLLGKDLK